MPMSNVLPLRSIHDEVLSRRVEAVTFEQFCNADANRQWSDRRVVNGWTVLQFPRLAIMCAPDGSCLANAYADTDIMSYLEPNYAELVV